MTASSDSAPAGQTFFDALAVYFKPRVLIVMFLGFSSGLPLALSGATLLVWMRESGVDPVNLVLEVTETTAVANIPRAQQFAARLAELGCRFALDDFGAGFGSFYYLKHLPFDLLKIDGEFVRSCTTSPTDQLLVRAAVDIARGLGKKTIAEYVGDDATVELLRELGVDYAQGFHIGRPEPLAERLEHDCVGL